MQWHARNLCEELTLSAASFLSPSALGPAFSPPAEKTSSDTASNSRTALALMPFAAALISTRDSGYSFKSVTLTCCWNGIGTAGLTLLFILWKSTGAVKLRLTVYNACTLNNAEIVDLTVNRSECTDPFIVRAAESDLNTADKLWGEVLSQCGNCVCFHSIPENRPRQVQSLQLITQTVCTAGETGDHTLFVHKVQTLLILA